MSSETKETTPLVNGNGHTASFHVSYSSDKGEVIVAGDEPEIKSYIGRWWILLVFTMAGLAQGVAWVTWPPLADALLVAYDWGVTDVALLSATNDIVLVLFALPVMYLVETKGLRLGMFLTNFTQVLGALIWILALYTNQFGLMVFGATLIGLGVCVTMGATALVSVIWFPVSQRTTATTIATLAEVFGEGLGFITGPMISGVDVTTEAVDNRDNLTTEYIDDLKHGLYDVGYYVCGMCAISFVLMWFYFPSQPPTPPSKSQTIEREEFLPGLKQLFKNKQFWILNFAYNITNGVFVSWLPLLSVSFRPLGISEDVAGMIGFVSIMSVCGSALVMSPLIDRCKRQTKVILRLFAVCSVVSLLALSLIQEYYYILPEESLIPLLYTFCIVASISTNAAMPLYYELGCEYAYPVHEGLTCTVIVMLNHAIGLVFLCLLLIPELAEDTGWMTWLCLGCCSVTFPLLLFLKDDFRRLDIDDKKAEF